MVGFLLLANAYRWRRVSPGLLVSSALAVTLYVAAVFDSIRPGNTGPLSHV
jgi:hypothetical protein